MMSQHLADEFSQRLREQQRLHTGRGEFVVFIQGIIAWLGLRFVVFALGYIERGGGG